MLDQMDLKSPVRADPTPINKSRLGIHHSPMPYSPKPQRAMFAHGLLLSIPWKKAGILGDVHTVSWLDVMKSSSPPPKQLTFDANAEQEPLDANVAYRSWMMSYPSALTAFEQITHYAKGKRLALFLDYDGTLSPIVNNPDLAFMSDNMRSAVKNVAKYLPTAIISGRSRDKVFKFVGLTELYYAGSHGMDIMSPAKGSAFNEHPNCVKLTDNQDKESVLFQPASEFIPMIEEVFRLLVESTKEIEGAKVEDNKFCVSVHYRNVDEKKWRTVAQRVHSILKEYPRLRLTNGRKVLEVRPGIDWNKGKAVEFLLESLGLSDSDDVLPIYIGDDRTDEDAFKVLSKRSRGYGILVSSVPKESHALYSLKDPSEVMEFLEALVTWKSTSD